MYIQKVNATSNKVKEIFHAQRGFLEIGILNRPRLCLIPALIVLGILLMVKMLYLAIAGKENFIVKMLHIGKEAAGVTSENNPLYMPDKFLPLCKLSSGEKELVGYLYNQSVLYSLRETVEAIADNP